MLGSRYVDHDVKTTNSGKRERIIPRAAATFVRVKYKFEFNLSKTYLDIIVLS